MMIFKKNPKQKIPPKMTVWVEQTRIRQKTASLIASGCELGALTTSKSKQDCKSMSSYGYNLGMAYQIRDDLFDLLGNESYTGKDIGIDVKKKSSLAVKIQNPLSQDMTFLRNTLLPGILKAIEFNEKRRMGKYLG